MPAGDVHEVLGLAQRRGHLRQRVGAVDQDLELAALARAAGRRRPTRPAVAGSNTCSQPSRRSRRRCLSDTAASMPSPTSGVEPSRAPAIAHRSTPVPRTARRLHAADRPWHDCSPPMSQLRSATRPAPARRRQARPGPRDLAGRERRPRGLGAGPRGLSAHRPGRRDRLHRAARGGQVDAAGGADQARARARADGRGAVDRPLLAVHQGRAARRPDPARPSISWTPACSYARWPTAARSAGSARRRSRRRC